MLRILALEPYYGGSHRAFLDGYRSHSRHRLDLLTMPARKWKWRMRGAALEMGRRTADRVGDFDVLFVSDFVDLAALLGMHRRALADVPAVAYFHENQLTYPVPNEDERDYQYGFTNITTCLAADRVLFNSAYHRDSFLDAAESMLRRMPDFVPDWAPDSVRVKSAVVPVGVDLEAIDRARGSVRSAVGPLRILWNHRWEYDKGAEEFFDVLLELQENNCDFRVAVTGESFRDVPEVFEEARRALADRIDVFGYVADRLDYVSVMLNSDVVVSTATQEFFGISIVEATYAGCTPLLPDRLSYPELLPQWAHDPCLYRGRSELLERLMRWCECPAEARGVDLGREMARFAWDRVAPMLDAVMEDTKGGRK